MTTLEEQAMEWAHRTATDLSLEQAVQFIDWIESPTHLKEYLLAVTLRACARRVAEEWGKSTEELIALASKADAQR
jgi:hypothetical protein